MHPLNSSTANQQLHHSQAQPTHTRSLANHSNPTKRPPAQPFPPTSVRFFLAYQESPKKGGRWIAHRPMIVRHYLKTWFVLDLCSTVPFQVSK